MRLFLLLLAWLFTATTAYADNAGRLRMGRGGTPPPVTSQTAYWGAKTLVGNGGYSITGLAGGAVLSAPDTTNYYWDATNRWVVPKLGANKTYNLSRGGSPLPASEVFTVMDSGGTVFTITNLVDAARAGNYTWRWRNGDSTGSTSGTAQLLRAWADSVYGDELAMRKNTSLNTTADCLTGCSAGATTLFNGTQTFRFACNMGNCTSSAGFTGSNHRVVRPELGGVNTIGPIAFESSQLIGFRFQNFLVDGEAESYNAGSMLATVLAASPTGPGPQDVIFENLVITGSSLDPYGKDRMDYGISVCSDCKTTIENVEISYVETAMRLTWGLGATTDVFVGSTAPNSGEVIVRNVYTYEIGRDVISTQCPRYLTVENSVFTDKKTEVTVGTASTIPAWLNPFASGQQPHADQIQLNMQNTSTNVCAWNLYPGLVIRNNFMGRGLGQDTLPFWVSTVGPPTDFPTPNNTSSTYGTGIPTQAATPNPLVSLGDAQGIVDTNAAADCPAIAPPLCPGADRKLVGGTTPRTYVATYLNPDVSYNTVFSAFNGGIVLWGVDGGTIVGNAVLPPRVAATTNLETWSGFGATSFKIYNITNSPTIARNVGGYAPQAGGGLGTPTLPTTAQMTTTGIADLTGAFQNPNSQLSPRNPAGYVSGGAWLPLDGGTLEFGANAFAGPKCPGGQDNTSATCPP